jgi:hypothetical protein
MHGFSSELYETNWRNFSAWFQFRALRDKLEEFFSVISVQSFMRQDWRNFSAWFQTFSSELYAQQTGGIFQHGFSSELYATNWRDFSA